VLLGSLCKIAKPYNNPSGRISNEQEEGRREKKVKKMPYAIFIVATYVYASSQGQRTHSARTNFFSFPDISSF
jgi:hypothetical protein